ncbi:MBL fold metallo-hydrolase [Streptomyces tanashiensis]
MTGTGSDRSPRARLRALRPESFGAEPTGERLARIRRSPNFADGIFQNPEPARRPLRVRHRVRQDLLEKEGRARRAPTGAIPVHPTTVADLARPPATGLRDLDALRRPRGDRRPPGPLRPGLGDRCSPFPFAGPKRLHPVPVPLAALGPVDVVVISHDHYDHLDLPTIKALAGTDTLFAVPLGVGAHLEHWGVSASRLRELDWNESTEIGELRLTATPARHFCGRGLRNTQHTLWASWVVEGPAHRIFHSGDTGYFSGFKDIGAAHGPFDATMIQIGAYSEFWTDIHMTPAEGVRSHLDLQGGIPGGVLLPIHWGTFNLAPHAWAEPGEWTKDAAEEAGQAVAFPRPGEPFEPAGKLPGEAWWQAVSRPIPRPWRRPPGRRGRGRGHTQRRPRSRGRQVTPARTRAVDR